MFSNQACIRNKRSSTSEPTANDQPVTQAEVESIINSLKSEQQSLSREVNDVKKSYFDSVYKAEVNFIKGMFRLIQLQPRIRGLERAVKRVEDALEEWTVGDYHDPARRTSNVINPKTLYASNRELGALEKAFRDSYISSAMRKIQVVERELRRQAFMKCCDVTLAKGQSGLIREHTLKTLGDSTGTKWDEDSALQLLKVLRQMEGLDRS